MIASRRAPREVYRLYGEHEYLAGAGHELHTSQARTRAGENRRLRVASVATLLGAVGAFGGAIALNMPPGSTGRRLPRRSAMRRLTAHTMTSVVRPRVSAPTHSASDQPRPGDAARRVYKPHGESHARVTHLKRSSSESSSPAASPTLLAIAVTPTRQSLPSAASPRYSARTEFGFER